MSLDNEINNHKGHLIVTGVLELTDKETLGPFQDLLGHEDFEENFQTYFQWYNIIHELGHIVLHQLGVKKPYGTKRIHEERLVNEFSVAFWSTYGEKSKLERVT